jgi:ERCC4-type nuclease
MDKIKLIIDDREHNILRHSHEFNNITWEKNRMQIGDYAIVLNDKLLAVLERKTYEDLAASIKDGRYDNKNGLINIREKTGCVIYYLIEGPISPKPSQTFGNIPYLYLESAIDHLIIRDNFIILFTTDTLHTATRLARMVCSLENLRKKNDLCNYTGSLDIIPKDTKPTNTIDTKDNEIDFIYIKEKTSDIDVVRSMWACFKGIAVITADTFMKKYTIGDIIRGLSKDTLEKIKYETGKCINKRVLSSLYKHDESTCIALLRTIPGISSSTAKIMLQNASLKSILSWDIGAISMMRINKKTLGDKVAHKIKKYFEWKLDNTNQTIPETNGHILADVKKTDFDDDFYAV